MWIIWTAIAIGLIALFFLYSSYRRQQWINLYDSSVSRYDWRNVKDSM